MQSPGLRWRMAILVSILVGVILWENVCIAPETALLSGPEESTSGRSPLGGTSTSAYDTALLPPTPGISLGDSWSIYGRRFIHCSGSTTWGTFDRTVGNLSYHVDYQFRPQMEYNGTASPATLQIRFDQFPAEVDRVNVSRMEMYVNETDFMSYSQAIGFYSTNFSPMTVLAATTLSFNYQTDYWGPFLLAHFADALDIIICRNAIVVCLDIRYHNGSVCHNELRSHTSPGVMTWLYYPGSLERYTAFAVNYRIVAAGSSDIYGVLENSTADNSWLYPASESLTRNASDYRTWFDDGQDNHFLGPPYGAIMGVSSLNWNKVNATWYQKWKDLSSVPAFQSYTATSAPGVLQVDNWTRTVWWFNYSAASGRSLEMALSNSTGRVIYARLFRTEWSGYYLHELWSEELFAHPTWSQLPTHQTIEEDGLFRYDLNATAKPFEIDNWWLNDTLHFAIDDSGVITNNSVLPPEVYGLQVWVNDTFGSVLNASFQLTVNSAEPPAWVQQPENRVIELGEGFRYDLNATDFSGLGAWWLNDSIRFDIDNEGIIVNATTLLVGRFGLQVSVSDTLGHVRSAEFTVTVQDTKNPTWHQVLTDQTVEFGASFRYDTNASDLSGIDHYWLNDTVHFSIDANGVIGTVGLVPVGVYGLEVRAYDPGNLFCAATFRVTIQDTAPPTWVVMPTDQVLEPGQALDYQLQAWDLSGIDEWAVNDTEHFSISGSGRLTSVGLPDPGRYGLTVTVSDPYGNRRTAVFGITVQGETSTTTTPPPGIPGFPLEAAVLGVAAALGFCTRWRRLRKESSS